MGNNVPASAFVNVIPNVASTGGSAVNLTGLILTGSTRPPINTIVALANATAVQNYFGPASAEAAAAAIYFSGFNGSSQLPGSLLFFQYNTANVAAYLRGGNISGLSLTQLQAISGVLTLTVNGTPITSSSITLSAATSFSNAATIIQAAFTSPPFTVTYDSQSGGFLFTDSTSGSSSTIGFCTGTASAALLLTQATGAVLSQGAAANTPAGAMAEIVALTSNWACFTTLTDPDNGSGNTNKQAFATWASQQNRQFLYVAWDTDATPTASVPATTSLGYILQQAKTDGVICVWGTDNTKAMFIMGWAASIDFTKVNGRTNLDFRYQAGLTADVTSLTIMNNLIANGYNCYIVSGLRNGTTNNMITNGNIPGIFKWVDSYVNQIWLNSYFQSALMSLLTSANSIPYNNAGYGLIRGACQDPITSAVNFGAIAQGVALSSAQIAEVNNAAGLAIDSTLSSKGWYLQILPASATTRGNRASPPMTFWYMDGGSVQQITLNSVEVQ